MKQEPKDRGAIKWTSLMLPEHVDMLRNLWKEDERVEQGWMEEQQAAGIDFVLKHAMNEQVPVRMDVHNGFDYEQHYVVPLRVDKERQTVECRTIEGAEIYEVAWSDIADVTI